MLGGVAREPIMCLVAYCTMFAAYGRYMFKGVPEFTDPCCILGTGPCLTQCMCGGSAKVLDC